MALIRKSMGEWRLLDQDSYCLNPVDCIDKRAKDVQDIISKSDPKLIDEAAVSGEFTLATKNIPEAEVPVSDWEADFLALRKILGLGPKSGFDITKAEQTLFTIRDVELKIAAMRGNWQWRAAQAWSQSKALVEPLTREMPGIAGEMDRHAHNYNKIIDTQNAFINLRQVKRDLTNARALLNTAVQLDPRLKSDDPNSALGQATALLNSIESDAESKVEQVCGIYLAPGRLGFGSGFSGKDWCAANPTDRWAKYPPAQ